MSEQLTKVLPALPELDDKVSVKELYSPEEFKRDVGDGYVLRSDGWLWHPYTARTHPELGIDTVAQAHVDSIYNHTRWSVSSLDEASAALDALGEVYLLFEGRERRIGRLDHFVGITAVGQYHRAEVAIESKNNGLYATAATSLASVMVNIDTMMPEQSQIEKDTAVRIFGLK